MNYKLYALLLICFLAATPALQAMRATRSLLATSRSLRPILQAGQYSLARTQFTQNKGHNQSQEEHRYGYDNYSIPAAAAIAVGLGLNTAQAMEETEYSQALAKLDMTNVNAILEILQNGSEDDKRELAQRIAQRITKYAVEEIIQMLLCTEKRPHRILVNAIVNKITYFTCDKISKILAADTQDETHDLLASALKTNYTYFAGYTIASFKYQTKGIQEYAQTISLIKNKYQNRAIEPLADDLTSLNYFCLLSFYCNNLLAAHEKSNDIIAHAIAYHVDKHSLCSLAFFLEITSPQSKEIVTGAIAQNIEPLITECLKLDGEKNMREKCLIDIVKNASIQNQQLMLPAIIEATVQNTFLFVSAESIVALLNMSSEENKTTIKKAIEQNIRIYVGSPSLQEFCIGQIQQRNIGSISSVLENIETLDESSLAFILAVSNDNNKRIITETMLKQIELFINENEIDSQTAAHLKQNISAAWQYIKIIGKNPKYKTAFKQALEYEQSISKDMAVFYHSQKSPVYWLELLYTKLWEQKHKESESNYLFTRFPDDFTEFSNAVLQYDGQQKRTELLKTGRKLGMDELRPYLLFANYALFGNSKNWGSCSVHYFINNINIGDPDITTKTIVDKFGDSALFAKYQTQFKQLENEFKDIVQGSVLLQFTIPHKALKDHVYLAAPGGFKKKLIISGEETDNIETIINTLKTAPTTMIESDEQEFCIITTPDTVHTLREQGAQVRVYGGFDQEKLDAFIKKLEALIAHIAQENPKTFSACMTPTQSYQAYKPVLDDLLQKKD